MVPLSCNDCPPSTQQRPNIIWIFGDQHRGCAAGFAGDPNVHTPNLDRFATEGTVFRNAVAGSPLCCPFRGSLLTSRYPHQCVPGHQHALPQGIPTVATAFNAAGYETAWFGKWHLDGHHEAEGRAAFHTVAPDRRGDFKQWIGYENNLTTFDCWIHGHDRHGNEVAHSRLEGYETDALTDHFIDYLKDSVESQAHPGSENVQTPFFAALSVIPPHNPFVAPAEWMQRHTPGNIQLRANVPPYEKIRQQAQRELAGYYAMVENLDFNFGRIRTALEELQIANNTIIFFFSDHGDMLGSHGQFRKTSVYQESLNIPCIVGGGIPFYEGTHGWVKPQVLNHPFNHVDFATTSLGLCGVDIPEYMSGFNYAPQISWKFNPTTPPPDSAFLQYCEPSLFGRCMDRPWRGILTDDGWKLACFENQPWVLFDLNDDPYEFINLAFYKLGQKRLAGLKDRLQHWIELTNDSFKLN